MGFSRPVPAAVVAVALAVSAAGCGTDDRSRADVIDDVYFADDRFLGDRVALAAEVKQVLSDESVVLEADDWGDASLLVVFSPDRTDIPQNELIQVTGWVRQFDYRQFAGTYGLAGRASYTKHSDELFLVATDVDLTPDTLTPWVNS